MGFLTVDDGGGLVSILGIDAFFLSSCVADVGFGFFTADDELELLADVFVFAIGMVIVSFDCFAS